jgi:uncharacterized protein
MTGSRSAGPVTSALSWTQVRHRRHRPAAHQLDVPTFHVLVDVDDLPRLDREVRGFVHNRRGPVAIHDRDHLGPLPEDGQVGSLRERVVGLLAAQDIELPAGPLQLLCHPRMFGHVFNPVSWWFAHHPDGRLGLVLAEVTSTFGDRVVYVLDELTDGANGSVRATAIKRLHVSPFLPVQDHVYRFVIRPPGVPLGERALVHMEVEDAEGLVLDATQRARLVPFTTRRLVSLVLRYPLVSFRSTLLIHLHALRLWAKRVPFHRRPTPPHDAIRVRGGHPGRDERGASDDR